MVRLARYPVRFDGFVPFVGVVWTGAGWRTLVWTDYQAGHIAAALGIGAGGPYEWAEDWEPRHPDRDLHDWTQEGRELHSRFPETTYQERTKLIDAARQVQEDALVAALADRGGMTPGITVSMTRPSRSSWRTAGLAPHAAAWRSVTRPACPSATSAILPTIFNMPEAYRRPPASLAGISGSTGLYLWGYGALEE
ncbi:hypothetical protein [Streptomyces lavendulocolor]|uniref:hypothetical protein n=1 Tax=Streptomyces lavendulocolor TaxID=67316 RepID=UPI003C2E9BAB